MPKLKYTCTDITLGVSYVEAQKDEIKLKINDEEICICQSSLGVVAISSVVWDAGLLLADFLAFARSDGIKNVQLSSSDATEAKLYKMLHPKCNLGKVLDIGSGTGIVGIISLKLGAESVTLSDMHDCCGESIAELSTEEKEKVNFVLHDWNHELPNELSSCVWDTITCSDLLYEKKAHEPLLNVLSKLKFKCGLMSYKRRHDAEESEFFRKFSEKFEVRAVPNDIIPLVNTKPNNLNGLYIILFTPKDNIV